MAEPSLDGLHRLAVTDQERGVVVPQGVEDGPGSSGLCADPWMSGPIEPHLARTIEQNLLTYQAERDSYHSRQTKGRH